MTGSVIQSFTSLFLVKRRRGLKLSTIVFPNIHFFFSRWKIKNNSATSIQTGENRSHVWLLLHQQLKTTFKKKKNCTNNFNPGPKRSSWRQPLSRQLNTDDEFHYIQFPQLQSGRIFFLVRWCLESECGKRNFLQTSVGNNTKEDQIVFVSEFLTDKKKKIKKTGNTNVYTLQPTRWQ